MGMPGILQQIARANPMLQTVKQMAAMVNTAQNPQAMMNQMIMSNPDLKKVIDVIKEYNGDPQKAFFALAEQKGVDPQEILNMLK